MKKLITLIYNNVISKPDIFIKKYQKPKLMVNKWKISLKSQIQKIFSIKLVIQKIGVNNYLYPNLYEFVAYVFTLPNSRVGRKNFFETNINEK